MVIFFKKNSCLAFIFQKSTTFAFSNKEHSQQILLKR